MSDVKYGYYHSSSGYKVISGGTILSGFLKADGTVDNNTYLKVFYTTDTLGTGVNFNTLSYIDKKSITIQPVHSPNYAGQLNTPFNDFGNIITITNSDSLFDHQIAISEGGVLKYRTAYNSNTFTTTWNEVLTTTILQKVIGIKQFLTGGNNAVTDVPLQAYSDNASFPAISFHKAGAYAGSIALTPTQYQFRNLSGNGFTDAKANRFFSDYGFVHDQYDDPNAILTSDGGVAYAEVDIINDSGNLRINPIEITSSGAVINCDNYQHKLIYIRVWRGYQINVENASQGQRFVLFNVDSSISSEVDINGSGGRLSPYTKISCYITDLGEIIFYDKAEIFIGGF